MHFVLFQQIWMLDSKGVIYKERGDELPHHKKIVARDDIDQAPPSNDLDVVVGHIKPHALIGLTGRGPAFTEVCLSSHLTHSDTI